MVNYYIAALKLLPIKEYESKQNNGFTINDVYDINCGSSELQQKV
jgi:hypothetical protein